MATEIVISNGDYIKLRRKESFRIILYFYPMTGRPDKTLPKNWNNIPGARGCTPENCSFRDNYDELVKLNALPIGITSQSIEDIKEMVRNKKILYDLGVDQAAYKWDGVKTLEKVDLSDIPEYISLNCEKYAEWLEN